MNRTMPRDNTSTPETRPTSSSTHDSKRKQPPPSVILYIDDDPSSIRLVRKVLEQRRNYMLLDASTADEGLRLARYAGPELKAILVDITLPDLPGHHVLKQCRQLGNTRDLPIIAVTASAMTHEIEAGLKAGFDHYLTKPLDISTFISVLDEVIGTPG